MRVTETELLSREDFDRLVKERSNGLCIFCKSMATDAHHIFDRKLFDDGGYYLGNGAAVCEQHHWDCETTVIPVATVVQAAGIKQQVWPKSLNPAFTYDKWGNKIVYDWLRITGPLGRDDGVIRALTYGQVIYQLRDDDGIFYQA